MKLSEDANARARLRMLRVWLTPEQYRDVCAGLKQVEVPPRGTLQRRLAAARGEARKSVVAHTHAMAGMIRQLLAPSSARRLP